MPQSKNRPGHHHHAQTRPQRAGNPKGKGSPVIIAVLFFVVLGFGISYFVAGGSTSALLVGGIVGAACGYIFGQQLNQTISRK